MRPSGSSSLPTFSWDGGEVTFAAADGSVLHVRHSAHPELDYLHGLALPTVRRGGHPLEWAPPTVTADSDELEVGASAGPLTAVLRHSFGAGWGMRLVLANTGDQAVRLSVELPLSVGAGCRGWGLAAGAEADYSVHPADGAGPLLGGSLRLGAVTGLSADGMLLDEVELAGAARYVLQWQWEWYASPRAYGASRLHGLAVTAALVEQPIPLLAGEDVVVLPPDQVGLRRDGEICEVTADEAGHYPVELRSARGRTSLDLVWADPPAAVIGAAAARLLARRPSPAGVVRLTGAAEALVVQHALAGGLVEPGAAGESLDLYTARCLEADRVTLWDAAYLSAEFDRTGDADPLAPATRAVLATRTARPGLGVTATRLAIALPLAGQSPLPVLRHVGALADALPPPSGRALSDQAAALELLAITRAGPGVRGAKGAEPAHQRADTASRVTALGAALGGGLSGSAIDTLEVATVSQVIGTLSLLPEAADDQADTWWGCSATALGRRALPGLLHRLADAEVGTAHAWLTLPSPAN